MIKTGAAMIAKSGICLTDFNDKRMHAVKISAKIYFFFLKNKQADMPDKIIKNIKIYPNREKSNRLKFCHSVMYFDVSGLVNAVKIVFHK